MCSNSGVRYNNLYTGSEGGIPNTHPAFKSGQDGFLASLETKGEMNETYWQALEFCQRTTREEGIDAALTWNGKKLDGLLVPSSVGQTYQIAAQAGMRPRFKNWRYTTYTTPGDTHFLHRISHDHSPSRHETSKYTLWIKHHEHGME